MTAREVGHVIGEDEFAARQIPLLEPGILVRPLGSAKLDVKTYVHALVAYLESFGELPVSSYMTIFVVGETSTLI
jgi:hypothetical protein